IFRIFMSGFSYFRLNFLPLCYEISEDFRHRDRVIHFLGQIANAEDCLKKMLRKYIMKLEEWQLKSDEPITN
ncbi:hypothetical protein PFISCL1PPCAC_12250, partial [Pristionchus fissidentatus]